MQKIYISLFLSISISLSAQSNKLYVTEEAINNFFNSDEFGLLEVSMDTVSGSKNSFLIKGLRFHDSNNDFVTIKSISCRGYKVNDYEFNTSFTDQFKLPPLNDVKNSITRPLKCNMDNLNLNLNFLNTQLGEEIDEEILESFDLYNDISLKVESKYLNKKLVFDTTINLSSELLLNYSLSLEFDLNDLYAFMDTFINNVVYDYWGYASYDELYSDVEENTSEISDDFIWELTSQPENFIEYMPNLESYVNLHNFSLGLSWSENFYKELNEEFPEIEIGLLTLSGFTQSKLNKEQFLMMLASQDQLAPLMMMQHKLYDIYESAFNAADAFTKNPKGMQIKISFDPGLNILPDYQSLISNPEIYGASMLMQSLMSLDVRFKANPIIN